MFSVGYERYSENKVVMKYIASCKGQHIPGMFYLKSLLIGGGQIEMYLVHITELHFQSPLVYLAGFIFDSKPDPIYRGSEPKIWHS